ncbi:hypothetical protein, partial [Pseudomonas sp. JAI120]|uniref:hypothetical protein n=1 Tax=Pseudomonas sp. JAI120 TaxID=2723063 RepID=UPI0030ED8FDF
VGRAGQFGQECPQPSTWTRSVAQMLRWKGKQLSCLAWADEMHRSGIKPLPSVIVIMGVPGSVKRTIASMPAHWLD